MQRGVGSLADAPCFRVATLRAAASAYIWRVMFTISMADSAQS